MARRAAARRRALQPLRVGAFPSDALQRTTGRVARWRWCPRKGAQSPAQAGAGTERLSDLEYARAVLAEAQDAFSTRHRKTPMKPVTGAERKQEGFRYRPSAGEALAQQRIRGPANAAARQGLRRPPCGAVWQSGGLT
jgi:hypothetical protein